MPCYSGTQFKCLQHNPLWQWVSQNLVLQQIVERDNSVWNRDCNSSLELQQQFSDFYDSNSSHNLLLLDTVVASVSRPIAVASLLSLSDSNTVSGGRFTETPEPLEAEFVSITLKGMPLYVLSNGTLDLANASTPSTSQVIVLAADDTSAGQIGPYLTEGQITRTNWSPITGTVGLTVGAFYYLHTTNGQLRTIPPSTEGQSSLSVGRALSSEMLDIQITQPILL